MAAQRRRAQASLDVGHGSQIAVAMTERDERDFVAFLRTTGDIQILAMNSPRDGGIELDAFPRRRKKDLIYRLNRRFALWNRAFDWQPEIQIRQDDKGVLWNRGSPIVEYSRHPFSRDTQDVGRLYWAKGLTLYETPYTDEQFQPWWNQLREWVKANHAGRRKEWFGYIYYLPHAWRWYGRWGRG